MRVNVDKVLECDQKLSDFDDRARFQNDASHQKFNWLANIKMAIIMGAIGVVLIILIIVAIWTFSSRWSSSEVANP